MLQEEGCDGAHLVPPQVEDQQVGQQAQLRGQRLQVVEGQVQLLQLLQLPQLPRNVLKEQQHAPLLFQ